ncbi:IclR family transcriptional regulator [Pleomorphochaeta sp. DL1XJH-081]|jgi:IclR family KDG regulon transcriptional repressor|uniref:IclR family transcriptional regulator n=1 Tax=Pleomorphochaeta sp. DL1XJH-081 TaxID=3409690 RepID=UPI003BB56007
MVIPIDPADKKAGSHLSSVERTLGILECLSGHHKINLERLAEETGLPKPTLHRFLSTLVNLGYVFRDENDQYSLTLRMFSVGSKGLSHMDLAQDARPVAENLGKTLGETVHMGVLDDDMAMYILKIESQYTIRMYSRVGKRIPLYCTAIGKILLADKSEDDAKKIIDIMELVPFTRTTIVGKQQLQQELKQIRERGFSEDLQEHEEGIRCIAAPVRDYSKRVIAGLSVSWPTFRFDEAKREYYIESVKKSADVISALMGY